MTSPDFEPLLRVLEEIRDNQKLQLERQAESMAIQREQAELAKRQFERAESLQIKSAQLVGGARKVMVVVLPSAAAVRGGLLLVTRLGRTRRVTRCRATPAYRPFHLHTG